MEKAIHKESQSPDSTVTGDNKNDVEDFKFKRN